MSGATRRRVTLGIGLVVALVAVTLATTQIGTAPAAAAPAPLPPLCSPTFTDVVCDPAAINQLLDEGFPLLEPDPIGLVGVEAEFGYIGLAGAAGYWDPAYICEDGVTIFGFWLFTIGTPYPSLVPCGSAPGVTPIWPGANASRVVPPFNGVPLLFWLGIIPAGYDVDFGSPDETGNRVQSIGTWPEYSYHTYEEKGYHSIDYRVYYRFLFIGVATLPGDIPFLFLFPGTEVTDYVENTIPYQVDESRGTLEP